MFLLIVTVVVAPVLSILSIRTSKDISSSFIICKISSTSKGETSVGQGTVTSSHKLSDKVIILPNG